jgi:hypothetical protein
MQWAKPVEASGKMMVERTALSHRFFSVSSGRCFDSCAPPWNNGDIVKLIDERKAASDD